MDTFTWKTYGHIHTEKNSDWYWIVGIITITIAIISVFMNNIVFAVLVIVGSFAMALFASKKPAIVDVTVSKNGVAFGKTFYNFNELESYWVETRDGLPRLILKSKRVFIPNITILIDESVDSENLKFFLQKHLGTEEDTEPIFEKILIYLGF